MKKLVLFLILICSCNRDLLVSSGNMKCGEPCYEGAGQENVGICRTGSWLCQDDGGMTCEGATYPGERKCNGLDNDCDGLVDSLTRSCYDGPPGTVDIGECRHGTQECSYGIWGDCTGEIIPRPEICNGLDDDCDGTIDEPDEIPLSFCYDGPSGTAGVGQCHPGISICIDGRSVCSNEQIPTPEVCNGLDDDCNGHVDDGNSQLDMDVVFVVDYSGSMEMPYVYSQPSAIARLSLAWEMIDANYLTSTYSFSLIDSPGPLEIDDGKYKLMGTNLDSYQLNGLLDQSIPFSDFGSGREPTLDSLSDLCDPSNPIGIVWRQGAVRTIIVFSDEVPQSYLDAGYPPRTIWSVGALCKSDPANPVIDVFTLADGKNDGNNVIPYGPWKYISDLTDGGIFDVEEPAVTMGQDMRKILTDIPCGGN